MWTRRKKQPKFANPHPPGATDIQVHFWRRLEDIGDRVSHIEGLLKLAIPLLLALLAAVTGLQIMEAK